MQGLLPISSRNFRVSLPPNGQRRPGSEKAHILLHQVQHFQPISEIVVFPSHIGLEYC